MKSKSIEIFVTGVTDDDIDLAIEESIRLITEGFLSGGDKNESGSFSFDVAIEEVHKELFEFKVYEFDEDGAERVALCIDAKDKEEAREKAKSHGVKNISDIIQI